MMYDIVYNANMHEPSTIFIIFKGNFSFSKRNYYINCLKCK